MSITKYLPFASLLNYLNEQNREPKDGIGVKLLKGLGHSVYAWVPAAALFIYGNDLMTTGEMNPIKQRQALVRMNEDIERVFGKEGLADTNHDGKIDFTERAEAFRRMGLESQIQFPRLEADKIKIGIKSYEQGKYSDAKEK